MTDVRSLLGTIALIAAAGLVVGGCSQNQPAVCTQADQLRQSVHQLQNTSLSENGMGSLTTALTQVRTELSELRTEASSQFKPQTDAVAAAVNQLQQSASAAKADPSASAFGQVGVALGGLQSSVEDLRNALNTTCGAR